MSRIESLMRGRKREARADEGLLQALPATETPKAPEVPEVPETPRPVTKNQLEVYQTIMRVAGIEGAAEQQQFLRKVAAQKQFPKVKVVPAKSAGPQLKLWPTQALGLSTTLLRSSLFSVGRNRTKLGSMDEDGSPVYEMLAIHASARSDGSRVRLALASCGTTMNQFDEAVYLEMMQIWRDNRFSSDPMAFSYKGLCKSLGHGVSGTNLQRIRDSVKRLANNRYLLMFSNDETEEVTQHSFSLISSLAVRGTKGDDDIAFSRNPRAKASFCIDGILRSVLASHGMTFFDEALHKTLARGYESWLHRYLMSHKSPHPPIRITRLATLMGVIAPGEETTKQQRHRILQALRELKKTGFITELKTFQDGEGRPSVAINFNKTHYRLAP